MMLMMAWGGVLFQVLLPHGVGTARNDHNTFSGEFYSGWEKREGNMVTDILAEDCPFLKDLNIPW